MSAWKPNKEYTQKCIERIERGEETHELRYNIFAAVGFKVRDEKNQRGIWDRRWVNDHHSIADLTEDPLSDISVSEKLGPWLPAMHFSTTKTDEKHYAVLTVCNSKFVGIANSEAKARTLARLKAHVELSYK